MVEALTFDESIGIAASAVVQRAVYPSGRFATAAWNLVSHNVCFLGAKIGNIPVASKESALLRQILSLLLVDSLRVKSDCRRRNLSNLFKSIKYIINSVQFVSICWISAR